MSTGTGEKTHFHDIFVSAAEVSAHVLTQHLLDLKKTLTKPLKPRPRPSNGKAKTRMLFVSTTPNLMQTSSGWHVYNPNIHIISVVLYTSGNLRHTLTHQCIHGVNSCGHTISHPAKDEAGLESLPQSSAFQHIYFSVGG